MTSSNQEEATPPVLAERPSHHHQNPLQLLELLVKGFCPTIIEDRVEIHDSPGIAEGGQQSSGQVTTGMTQPLFTTTELSPYQLCNRGKALKEPIPVGLSPQPVINDKDKPFEIGERPPSDVIGISKKIWEGFCSNSHFHNSRNQFTHPTQQPPTHQHRGFCSIWVDQYRALHFDDKEPVPEGEEMSVSTTCTDSGSVDLSPQSSCGVQQLSSAENAYTRDDVSVLDMSIDFIDEEEDEDEDEPVAEFELIKRSHRGIQVLLATVLAMYATFALLQNWDIMNHQKFHFALQPKQGSTNREMRRRTLGIRLSRKDNRLDTTRR